MTAAARDGIVLAVDGGGSKTDLALLDQDGELLGHARGGRSQVHYLGVDGTVEVLRALLEQAARQAGLDPRAQPIATSGYLLLAGIDLPEEHAALERGMAAVGWSRELTIGNDTDALLRAGTDRGWGVAVVAGTGVNCLGRSADGREARFLSFGDISGDWGGGRDIGVAALAAAVRAADGRGRRTVLERVLPEHFGVADPLALAQELHLGRIPATRVGELCPIVFSMRDQDAVCAAIAQRFSDEIAGFVRAAATRLDLLDSDADVVLGGGVHRGVDAGVIAMIASAIHAFLPRADVKVSPSDPIAGAALFGLDALGAGPQARARARAALDAVVTR